MHSWVQDGSGRQGEEAETFGVANTGARGAVLSNNPARYASQSVNNKPNRTTPPADYLYEEERGPEDFDFQRTGKRGVQS